MKTIINNFYNSLTKRLVVTQTRLAIANTDKSSNFFYVIDNKCIFINIFFIK